MTQLPEAVRDFRSRGRFENVAGLDVFTLDEGDRSLPPLLLLHGFPTSSYDWHRTLDRLTTHHRVLCLDFPGFGFSEKPTDYSYSLFEQADVVEVWLARLGVPSVHVVAHDMGTSVATELVARRRRKLLTFHLQSLLLMNGSVHIAMAQLTPSQLLLRSPLGPVFVRASTPGIFRAQIRRILARPVPDREIVAMWSLLCHRHGRERMPQIIRYLEERRRFHRRWVDGLRDLDVPAHVLWGVEDPVAVPAIGERLAADIPGAALERLAGVGHYPQLEAPEETADSILRFLRRAENR
ncbi:MAG: alpha/beta hydrolase [Myxococcota bacterium]